jgi:hypothetical protein
MKKIIITLITIFTISLGYSQDSKAYLGISLGVAIPGGDIADNVNTGIDLGFINFGYRFSEYWGATLNLVSSGHTVDNDFGDETVGVGYFGLGPMYTTNISDNLSWDIKPQLALGLAMVNEVEGIEFNGKGNGFIFGNSLVFGSSKGFKFSINLDYLMGKITEVEDIEVDEDNSFNKLSIGAGLRYNF